MLINEAIFPDFMHWLGQQSEIAIDTETTGLNAYEADTPDRICGVSIAGHDGSAVYLPFRHKVGYNMPLRRLHELTELLTRRAASGATNLLMWNAKFDLHMLAADGFEPRLKGGVEDQMLGAHLLNENEPSFGLKEYADKYGFGRGSLDERALREEIEKRLGRRTQEKEWKGLIWTLPADLVAPYAETDGTLTLAAANAIRGALEYWRLTSLFAEVNDYMLMVWRMERRGIPIDRAKIMRQMATLGPLKVASFDRVIERVQLETGSKLNPIVKPMELGVRGMPLKQAERKMFNPGSTDQLQFLTGWPTTDVKYLESLEHDDPWKSFADDVLDWRVLSKMSGTYYDAYLTLMDRTNVLRPNYNMHGTVSGRLSCSRPNLQNVPRYSERRPIKEIFIPREGYVLLEMDYQQAELRLAAHYANERTMRAVFDAGLDPHGETARKLGIPRFVAKTLNFLIIYGGGIKAIMRTLKCSESVAKAYLYGYHGLYKGFRPLSNYCSELAERQGYIRYETGRMRHFNTWKRYKWEAEPRKAMNSLIQGSAAEMLRIGMLRIDDRIRAESVDAYPLLQVHDSLLIEIRPAEIQRFVPMLTEEMTSFGFNPAPAIDVKIGTSWAPMTELELAA